MEELVGKSSCEKDHENACGGTRESAPPARTMPMGVHGVDRICFLMWGALTQPERRYDATGKLIVD